MSPPRKLPQDLQKIFTSIQGLVSSLLPARTKRGRRTDHIPDVLIRIKRNLNDTEEAIRSATLGADLTLVASLAESFSQLRSRANAVKSDLVDALDREGLFFVSFHPSRV